MYGSVSWLPTYIRPEMFESEKMIFISLMILVNSNAAYLDVCTSVNFLLQVLFQFITKHIYHPPKIMLSLVTATNIAWCQWWHKILPMGLIKLEFSVYNINLNSACISIFHVVCNRVQNAQIHEPAYQGGSHGEIPALQTIGRRAQQRDGIHLQAHGGELW